MNKPDYIKLSVLSTRSLHDAEATSRRPRYKFDRFVTSWTFNFTTKGEKAAALLAAQTKRKQLQDANPDVSPGAFRLSTYRQGSIRGVPGVGYLSAASVAELQAVAS